MRFCVWVGWWGGETPPKLVKSATERERERGKTKEVGGGQESYCWVPLAFFRVLPQPVHITTAKTSSSLIALRRRHAARHRHRARAPLLHAPRADVRLDLVQGFAGVEKLGLRRRPAAELAVDRPQLDGFLADLFLVWF